MLAFSHGELAPPPTGNPGSGPVGVSVQGNSLSDTDHVIWVTGYSSKVGVSNCKL